MLGFQRWLTPFVTVIVVLPAPLLLQNTHEHTDTPTTSQLPLPVSANNTRWKHNALLNNVHPSGSWTICTFQWCILYTMILEVRTPQVWSPWPPLWTLYGFQRRCLFPIQRHRLPSIVAQPESWRKHIDRLCRKNVSSCPYSMKEHWPLDLWSRCCCILGLVGSNPTAFHILDINLQYFNSSLFCS